MARLGGAASISFPSRSLASLSPLAPCIRHTLTRGSEMNETIISCTLSLFPDVVASP